MDEHNKNIDKLINDLKNLPKVNTPVNFEDKLWDKISSLESRKESFWKNIFSQKRIIPAAVAVASAVIIFFIIDIKSTEVEDPLNMQPRMREDVILVKDYDDIDIVRERPELKEIPEKNLTQEKPQSSLRSNESEKNIKLGKEKSSANDNAITEGEKPESLMKKKSDVISEGIHSGALSAPEPQKDNFNFMQIKLSEKQKKEVELLKQRLQSAESVKSSQN